MLQPSQFATNEAWIAFRLNDVPIRTAEDGDFNCVALMDAGSGLILGNEIFPVAAAEPDELQSHRLFQNAEHQSSGLPTTLLVAREDQAGVMTRVAQLKGIEVVRVAESELLVFTKEARDGYTRFIMMGPQ